MIVRYSFLLVYLRWYRLCSVFSVLIMPPPLMIKVYGVTHVCTFASVLLFGTNDHLKETTCLVMNPVLSVLVEVTVIL